MVLGGRAAQYGRALEIASPELRADREVVMAAVRQRGWALNYASPELRADREVWCWRPCGTMAGRSSLPYLPRRSCGRTCVCTCTCHMCMHMSCIVKKNYTIEARTTLS